MARGGNRRFLALVPVWLALPLALAAGGGQEQQVRATLESLKQAIETHGNPQLKEAVGSYGTELDGLLEAMPAERAAARQERPSPEDWNAAVALTMRSWFSLLQVVRENADDSVKEPFSKHRRELEQCLDAVLELRRPRYGKARFEVPRDGSLEKVYGQAGAGDRIQLSGRVQHASLKRKSDGAQEGAPIKVTGPATLTMNKVGGSDSLAFRVDEALAELGYRCEVLNLAVSGFGTAEMFVALQAGTCNELHDQDGLGPRTRIERHEARNVGMTRQRQ